MAVNFYNPRVACISYIPSGCSVDHALPSARPSVWIDYFLDLNSSSGDFLSSLLRYILCLFLGAMRCADLSRVFRIETGNTSFNGSTKKQPKNKLQCNYGNTEPDREKAKNTVSGFIRYRVFYQRPYNA